MLKFQSVSFRYETGPEPLFQNLSLHAPPGWTGVVGANGCGKTTLLKLSAGLLTPTQGQIKMPSNALYCPQRTDHPPEELGRLLETATGEANIVKERLGLQDDWIDRWTTLSHGERKKAQIAVALWLNPGLLAIDEPTNHVDGNARDVIVNALLTFRGVGLLVSHDRLLIDTLCTQCIFIDPPEVSVRPGGYTKGIRTITEERQTVRKQYAVKKQAYKKMKKEMARRRELADQHRKKRSKRNLNVKDHDAREKIDRARITGKDVVGGKLKRQLAGRFEQARSQAETIRVKKEYDMGIWLPGSRSKRDFLLKLAAGSLALGREKRLDHPEIHISPTDRIALTGPNGTGKSTLIRTIVKALDIPWEQLAYLPQEVDLSESKHILDHARNLPHDRLGHLMNIVSRLGSRPQRLLDSRQPSPGEIRKLLLALGMTRMPHMIVMDEPTNHMDLPSIECLEQALSDCPCCLLLVSHDELFLDKLAQRKWRIGQDPHTPNVYTLEMLA